MKAQTYYRCEDCGKIVAQEAGILLTSCPDCGHEKLKVLVPVDNDAMRDPLSDHKKKAMGALIGLAGFTVLIVFLIFGWLLRDYIVFDAKRDESEKINERLVSEIQQKEATLTAISKKVSDAQLDASESAKRIEESTLSAKASLEETENALQHERDSLTNAIAKITEAKTELSNLDDQKSQMRTKVDMLEAEEAQLASINRTAVTRTNQLASDVAAFEAMQKAASVELAKIQTALDVAQAARDKAKEQAEVLAVRITSLSATRDDLEADIQEKQKAQAALAAAILELKSQQATNLEEEAKTRAVLDTLITTRDKAREEADVQSARSARLNAEITTMETAKTNATKDIGGTVK